MKRVFLIHGWDGYPENNWFPWLKTELEARGFAVVAPTLPAPSTPHIKEWTTKISEVVGVVDRDTYFVGHSIGCQAIARYLETLPAGEVVGGAVFVGGFFKALTNLEDNEEVRVIAREWLETPIDLLKARSHMLGSYAIFSDDDRYVPLDNQNDFKDKLGSVVVVENNKGHFDDARGIKILPPVLAAILELSRAK